MANPFRVCAGVCGGHTDHAANLGSAFTLRLTAVMIDPVNPPSDTRFEYNGNP